MLVLGRVHLFIGFSLVKCTQTLRPPSLRGARSEALSHWRCLGGTEPWKTIRITDNTHISEDRQQTHNLTYMGVSENSGFSPQIIHFNRVFHYKPSIWGTTIFGNPHMPLSINPAIEASNPSTQGLFVGRLYITFISLSLQRLDQTFFAVSFLNLCPYLSAPLGWSTLLINPTTWSRKPTHWETTWLFFGAKDVV